MEYIQPPMVLSSTKECKLQERDGLVSLFQGWIKLNRLKLAFAINMYSHYKTEIEEFRIVECTIIREYHIGHICPGR